MALVATEGFQLLAAALLSFIGTQAIVTLIIIICLKSCLKRTT